MDYKNSWPNPQANFDKAPDLNRISDQQLEKALKVLENF